MAWVRIDELDDLLAQQESYVEDLVAERIKDIEALPPGVRAALAGHNGRILDVGPGEGVSSMALAHIAASTQVVGVEMDKDHLRAAWPMCRDCENLKLYWGGLPGTPSNPLVKAGFPAPPKPNPSDVGCSVLFTWTGMSRRDVFDAHASWSPLVEDACVLILPRFWREGLDYLPSGDRQAVDELCRRLGFAPRVWPPYTGISSFGDITSASLDVTLKARGWILWLSGIFDGVGISLWDTLVDRWQAYPKYQLPEIRLELEAIVARR